MSPRQRPRRATDDEADPTADADPAADAHAEASPVADGEADTDAEPVKVVSDEPGEQDTVDETVPEIDVAELLAERDSYLEDLQRVTAEFTNFRRQSSKRSADQAAQGALRLAEDLLPVLDACEAAVEQGVEGIESLHSQLLAVLRARGLEVLGAVDEAFDPNLHEAVIAESSDDDDDDHAVPVVTGVMRTGYSWQGRVLRAAMVKVRS